MFNKIRKKLASSVVKTETPEQFLWDKWLRTPYLDSELITSPSFEFYNADDFNEWLNLPDYFKITIEPIKVRVSKKINKSSTIKSKTHNIFFGFGSITAHEIKFFEKERLKFNFILSFVREGPDLFLKAKKDHKEDKVNLTPSVFNPSFRINKTKTAKLIARLNQPEYVNFDFNLFIPQIDDLLLPLFPEIYNIELLSNQEIKSADYLDKNILIQFNPLSDPPLVKKIKILKSEELITELSKSANYKKNHEVRFNFIDKHPRIYKVKVVSVDKAKVPIYFLKNVQAKETETFNKDFSPLKEPSLTKESFHLNFVKNDQIESDLLSHQDSVKPKQINKSKQTENKEQILIVPVKDSIEAILHPSIDLNEEEKAKLYYSLFNYQKEGVEFLTTNKYALLSDELGLGKTVQAISALRVLFKRREIKSALIISNSYEIENPEIVKSGSNWITAVGWAGELTRWAPELSLNIIADNEDSTKKWITQSQLYLTSYAQFISDLKNDKLSKEKLKKFDCIVFDEVQFLLNKNVIIGKLIAGINTKYLIALSSVHNEEIIESINSTFEHINPSYQESPVLHRTKNEVKDDLPNLLRQEYWISLDDDQKIEYENTLAHGREKISQLVQAGNPFLIQSNIFTLLHQLKQVCNFSSHCETSPKTELLLKHVELIAKNHQKVLILTQYDRLGIQKLEHTFKKHGISYLVYQTSMSIKEMENVVKNFKKNDNITVLFVSLKASIAKLDITDIPYIIHFDQWWNPITLWQMEEKFNYPGNGHSESNRNLTVYSYLTKGTVEEKIKEKLSSKGLLEKNIIETLPPEAIYEFINNDEWLDILDIAKTKKNNSLQKTYDKLNALSSEDLSEKTKSFFTKLGYKNLMVKPLLNDGTFELTGSINRNNKEIKMSAKCFTSKISEKHAVSDTRKNNGKDRKYFLISMGKFDQEENNSQFENISIINGESFTKYLMQFKLI